MIAAAESQIEDQFLDEEEEAEVLLTSYLIAELGSSNTVVTLYDVVNGSFQLVGRGSSLTSVGSPWSDVVHGLNTAIQQVSSLTGRKLLGKADMLIQPERADGSGIDYFGVIISAAPPIRTLLVGLTDDYSLTSARRALQTIYSQEIDCFSLSDPRTLQEKVEALIPSSPDLIFIVGGTDGGASGQLIALVNAVALGLRLIDRDRRPVVIYAGNQYLQARVGDLLGEETDVYFLNNLRPSLQRENLDQAIGLLGDFYSTSHSSHFPGGESVIRRSDLPVLPAAHAYGAICEYLAALARGKVLGVDVGSSSVTLISAEPDRVKLYVNSGIDREGGSENLSNHLDDILAWSGDGHNKSAIEDYIANKSIWSGAVPLSKGEMHVEQALAWSHLSYSIQQAYQQWDWTKEKQLAPTRTLVLRGSALVNASDPKRLILLLLDALQPVGIFNVLVDKPGVLPALGLMATYNPHLVVQVLGLILKNRVGWVIAPRCSGQNGDLVVKLEYEVEGQDPKTVEILHGDIKFIALGAGQSAKIAIHPTSQADVGAGLGKSRTLNLRGGPLGLAIDGRGRPMHRQSDKKDRQRSIHKWLSAIKD